VDIDDGLIPHNTVQHSYISVGVEYLLNKLPIILRTWGRRKILIVPVLWSDFYWFNADCLPVNLNSHKRQRRWYFHWYPIYPRRRFQGKEFPSFSANARFRFLHSSHWYRLRTIEKTCYGSPIDSSTSWTSSRKINSAISFAQTSTIMHCLPFPSNISCQIVHTVIHAITVQSGTTRLTSHSETTQAVIGSSHMESRRHRHRTETHLRRCRYLLERSYGLSPSCLLYQCLLPYNPTDKNSGRDACVSFWAAVLFPFPIFKCSANDRSLTSLSSNVEVIMVKVILLLRSNISNDWLMWTRSIARRNWSAPQYPCWPEMVTVRTWATLTTSSRTQYLCRHILSQANENVRDVNADEWPKASVQIQSNPFN
jgi:hypothetical protein